MRSYVVENPWLLLLIFSPSWPNPTQLDAITNPDPDRLSTTGCVSFAQNDADSAVASKTYIGVNCGGYLQQKERPSFLLSCLLRM